MNESAANEKLMKIVERAVRPLHAGKVRKLAMREELLGHLTAIYNEELNRRQDEPAALSAAIERFGDPPNLSRELAGSLGWRDHWAWLKERWAKAIDGSFGWQPDESFHRFALRSGSAIALLNFLLFAGIFAVVRLVPDSFDPTFASFNRYTFTLFVNMAVSEMALLWAIQSTYHVAFRSDRPRRWLAATISLVGWTALFVLLGAAFWFGITLSLESALAQLPRNTLLTAATLPLILLLTARLTQHAHDQNQPYERWSRLELDQ
jgi:fumarate reductase subunit C